MKELEAAIKATQMPQMRQLRQTPIKAEFPTGCISKFNHEG